MTEIVIKTNCDIYNTGDVLYGAVYLKIDGPTSGYGVKVTMRGYEQYTYHDIRRLKSPRTRLSDGCVQHGSKIIMDEQLILCIFKGPIAIGTYVFPFKLQIPYNLPGSFYQRSWYGPKWAAEVSYKVTAEVIGAEQIKTTTPIHLNHMIGDPSVGLEVNASKKVTANKYFRVMKTDFSFSVSLDKTAYFIGDTIKLSVIFHSSKADIKEINIKLRRDICFIPSRNSPASPNHKSASFDEERPGYDPDPAPLHPEESSTVWEAPPLFTKALLGSMVPSVYIPLEADVQGHGLQPTTDGVLIKCEYTILLSIDLTVGEKVETEILVPCISVKKTPHSMSETEYEPWMKSCNVIYPMDFNPEEEWKGWSLYADAGFPTLSLIRSPCHRHRDRRRDKPVHLEEGLLDLATSDFT